VGELWVFSFTSQHIITKISGFGKVGEGGRHTSCQQGATQETGTPANRGGCYCCRPLCLSLGQSASHKGAHKGWSARA
jgi:hypothetical protein